MAVERSQNYMAFSFIVFIGQYPMLPYFVTITKMRYCNRTASPRQVGRKSAAGRLAQPELYIVMVMVMVKKYSNIGY